MFDFEKLEVYSKAKRFNSLVSLFLGHAKVSKNKKDQLERTAFSIMLNIAEGTGRFTKPDKRNFYIIARGSVLLTSLRELTMLFPSVMSSRWLVRSVGKIGEYKIG